MSKQGQPLLRRPLSLLPLPGKLTVSSKEEVLGAQTSVCDLSALAIMTVTSSLRGSWFLPSMYCSRLWWCLESPEHADADKSILQTDGCPGAESSQYPEGALHYKGSGKHRLQRFPAAELG